MPSATRKASPPATPAVVSLTPLKNCLLNLPQSLVSVLVGSNTPAQNVVVEMSYRVLTATGATTTAPKSAYAGWTGMQSKRKPSAGTRGSEEAVVEMDPAYARNVGLGEGSKVSLHLHLDPPPAHTLHIEPLTPSDWEIIELHASFLELNLLSQLRCVTPAHPLSVYLSPTSTASIRLTKVEPESALSAPNGFAKISPDAEIIVAPKTRQRRQSRGAKSTTSTAKGGGRKKMDATTSGTPGNSLFLRGVALPVGRYNPKADDDGEEEEEDEELEAGGRGFTVYLDPTTLSTRLLRGVSNVAVSIVRPPGLAPPQDPSQQQQNQQSDEKEKKEKESEILPAAKLIASVKPWDSAPDSKHIALSKLLACALHLPPGEVGEMIRIEPATPQISQKALSKVKIYPFTGNDKDGGLDWGGGTKRLEDLAIARLQEVLGARRQRNGTKAMIEEDQNHISPGEGTLEGALTDGMILPAIKDSPISTGAILKIEVSSSTEGGENSNAAQGLKWFFAAEKKFPMEISAPIPCPPAPAAATSETAFIMAETPVPIVGIDNILSQVTTTLVSSSSVLLSGAHGSGKTSILRLMAQRLSGAPHYYRIIDPGSLSRLSEERVGGIKENFNRWFSEAAWCSGKLAGGSIVLLDDLDRLCAAESENQDNSRARQVAEVVVATIKKYCASGRVRVLASTQAKESAHSLVVGGHVFREIVALKAMTKEGRRKVLEGVVKAGVADKLAGSGLEKGLDLGEIAARTEGYMPGDLVLLIGRTRHEAVVRMVDGGESKEGDLILKKIDFDSALSGFVPASLRGVKLQTSGASWKDIGGLTETRKILLETLEWPTKYAPIFASCPLRLRSGLLLYGYPGCGKTLLASAVAKECGLNFISVKGPEILNKYIGASEKSVRDLFERASGAKPCVLFFDEFDSIAPKRGHDSTGVTDRVVNQMLTQMDGAEGLDGVYVLAATSRPDLIDPALLRPGRLDKSLLCDLPNHEDRVSIFDALATKLHLAPEVGFQELARRTEGYSGADLQAVLYNAHLDAIQGVIGEQERRREEGLMEAEEEGQGGEEVEFLEFVWGDSKLRKAKGVNGGVVGNSVGRDRAGLIEKLEALKKSQSSSKYNKKKSQEEEEASGPGGEGSKSSEVVINWDHIENSLSTTRPSIAPDERKRLHAIYTEFVGQRSGDMRSGEGSHEVGGRSSLM